MQYWKYTLDTANCKFQRKIYQIPWWKKLDGTEYIGHGMHWLKLEHMRLYNKNVLWDTWTIYNKCEKCANQENSYECGTISIRFIDLDTIGASL